MSEEALWDKIRQLESVLNEVKRRELGPQWVFLTAPLTSTSFDGDDFSTTAKTLIDLSAVFGVPANIKAAYFRTACHDDASASGDYYLILSPVNTVNVGIASRVGGLPNATYHETPMIVPCDSNGDCYYQVAASGALKFSIILQIWGYAI